MTVKNAKRLALAVCVDLGHHWQFEALERVVGGRLHGLPRRRLSCTTCGGVRVEVLGAGGLILSRSYKHAESYLEAMRSFGDVAGERRARYREALVEAPRRKPRRRAT